MTPELLQQVSEMVAFWEESNRVRLIEAHPYVVDGGSSIYLYATWLALDKQRFPDLIQEKNWKFARQTNGISSSATVATSLQDVIAMVESRHGVVLDHIVVKRSENHILVLWHETGKFSRYSGRAPIAEALVPVQCSEAEKGVA